jgi:hypothetical protein
MLKPVVLLQDGVSLNMIRKVRLKKNKQEISTWVKFLLAPGTLVLWHA